jgi:[ribosomal protein S5]-alanine N-acetyltransferase
MPGVEIERVRTARLTGTRPVFRDADELHPVLADERVAPWLFPDGPPTAAQVRSLLVRDADHWKRHRWGPWVVRDGQTGAMLGRVGLESTEVGGREEVEVAWAIAADRWGEGLATEMAAEAVRVAFDVVGLPDLVAFTLVDNGASRRVMEHLGFAYERDVEHAGLPHVLYRLTNAGPTAPR